MQSQYFKYKCWIVGLLRICEVNKCHQRNQNKCKLIRERRWANKMLQKLKMRNVSPVIGHDVCHILFIEYIRNAVVLVLVSSSWMRWLFVVAQMIQMEWSKKNEKKTTILWYAQEVEINAHISIVIWICPMILSFCLH